MRLFSLALLFCGVVAAQTTSSRIAGTITDPAGAAIPGATVTVLNADTGLSFSAVTGAQGEYAIPSIPAATYKVTVAAKGFRTGVVTDVKLDAAVPATVNMKLEVGSL